MHRYSALLLASLIAPAFAADDAALLDEARKVASSVPPKLVKVLAEEMAKSGPEQAITICREKAPQMAAAASAETGWAIRRVSLKNRNPKAVPDAWERTALEDFDKRVAAGEKAGALEKGEVVADGDKKTYRYIKALPTQELCLKCHGTSERVSPSVKAKIDELYPDDKAVGYGFDVVRGAITIKKPL